MAEHFREYGLTRHAYLRAALKQPALFLQAPATIIANLEAVALFRGEGLSLPEYLRAALRQPNLFIQSAATGMARIAAVAEHFREHGLTRHAYLRAALAQPSLFSQKPASIIAKIEAVAGHFQPHGLTLGDYLRAALQLPSLFYQRPATIIRHLGWVIEMQAQGLLTFPSQTGAPAEQPLRPLLAFLLRWPRYLTLSDDNYALRLEYARVSGERPGGTALLTRPRRRVEQDLARSLSQATPPPGRR